MNSAKLVQHNDGLVEVHGSLQHDTVSSLYDRIKFNQLSDQNVLIDLSAVESVDSAGLALCLFWISQAQSHIVSIEFRGVPEQMRRLASMNRVDDLFLGQNSE